MIVHFIIFSILFIPSTYTFNATLPKIDKNVNSIVNVIDGSINKTKLPLQHEGVSSLTNKSVLTPKVNNTVDLLDLDQGFGNVKEKPVHARKGVNLPDWDPKQNVTIDLNALDISNTPIEMKNETKFKNGSSIGNVSIMHNKNDTLSNVLTKDQGNAKVDDAVNNEKPKKPIKTVYETLASLDQEPMTVKTSAHTLILDQIPSPKRDANAGKNPGMITPIVITILVVPMFAVLGYMALKRGQEAWKNRHYKRMDFLLDGMYND